MAPPPTNQTQRREANCLTIAIIHASSVCWVDQKSQVTSGKTPKLKQLPLGEINLYNMLFPKAKSLLVQISIDNFACVCVLTSFALKLLFTAAREILGDRFVGFPIASTFQCPISYFAIVRDHRGFCNMMIN